MLDCFIAQNAPRNDDFMQDLQRHHENVTISRAYRVTNNTIKSVLQRVTTALSRFAENPALEAEILLSHVLEKPRTYLIAWPEQEIPREKVQLLEQLLKRRLAKEPLAYITGSKEFWSLELTVTRDTLIPRPETELLVETILSLLPTTKTLVADLGTGSGAIALALASERKDWQLVATDASVAALDVARVNAKRHHIKNIEFYQGNWCEALPHQGFHAIVSNPPYIAENEWQAFSAGLEYEPRSALLAEDVGFAAIKAIIQQAPNYLLTNGYVMLEHGYTQAQNVRQLFAHMHYENIRTVVDLAGHERVTLAMVKK